MLRICVMILVILPLVCAREVNPRHFATSYSNFEMNEERSSSYSYSKPSFTFKRIKAFLINDNEIPDNVKENAFVEEVSYSYDENDPYGPSNWGKIDPRCDGQSQSPIALTSRNLNRNAIFKPIVIDNANVIPEAIKYDNSGHSVKLTFQYKNGKPAVLRGGPLGNVPYYINSLHWHWGESDTAGSEHTLDGMQYSAEVHLVSYNSKYGDLGTAISRPDGLAVLGVFYHLNNSAPLNPWYNAINKVIQKESSFTDRDNLFSLLDVIKFKDFSFAAYQGSLTTPGCSENVKWHVSYKSIPIRSVELAEFRKVLDTKGKPLVKNFRPIQSQNRRKQLSINLSF